MSLSDIQIENRKKWCEALRSGSFKQGKGQLVTARDNTYCCLGVLVTSLGRTPECSAYLTQSEADLAGLKRGEQQGLAQLNDSGKTFNEIADIIESNAIPLWGIDVSLGIAP